MAIILALTFLVAGILMVWNILILAPFSTETGRVRTLRVVRETLFIIILTLYYHGLSTPSSDWLQGGMRGANLEFSKFCAALAILIPPIYFWFEYHICRYFLKGFDTEEKGLKDLKDSQLLSSQVWLAGTAVLVIHYADMASNITGSQFTHSVSTVHQAIPAH